MVLGALRALLEIEPDLEVCDNGRGGLAPEGSGLSGIRERLRQVAGTLERHGQNGTRLVMSLPQGHS